MDIEKLKEEIHKADKDHAEAYDRRMEAVKGTAEYKKAHGISAEETIHDQPIVDSDAGFIEDPEIRSYFVPFLKSALKASKALQNTMMAGQRIAYCGGMDPRDYSVAGNAFPGRTRVAFPN